MNKTAAAIASVLVILTIQSIAQESQNQKTTEVAIVVSPYSKMGKQQLQEELKRLQKEYTVSLQANNQAVNLASEADKAYNSASNEEKPEALIRKLDAEANSYKTQESFQKKKKEFEAAQYAYIKRLQAE